MRFIISKRENLKYLINYLNKFSFLIKWREHTFDISMHNRLPFARPIILTSLMLCALSFSICLLGSAQILEPYHYQIGTPVLTDIWIDPAHGDNSNNGLTREHPLRTIAEAWGRIPEGSALTRTGYRIWLLPGDYREGDMPTFWESRYGTYQCPIIIQAYGGRHTSFLHAYIDLYDSKYVYFLNLDIITDPGHGGGGDVLHLAKSDHILVNGCKLDGFDGTVRQPQETLKANQAQYIYVEDSDISGAFWFPLDYVAVQYGHIVGCRIHNAGDWCMVLKGGSAYLRVEANEIFDGETGGFTAGQGTGFNWMVSPWLHYEAYDIKFINNVVHNTGTTGIGVNGGYNILMAYNTLYKVGINDHAAEIVHGARGCDGDPTLCQQYNAAGGWGTSGSEDQYIPCRNVYVYNNIMYNPTGYHSQWEIFAIRGAVTPPPGSNVPNPSLADRNLRIKGNLIWNGPPDDSGLPILGEDSGCADGNPTCNILQLRSDNTINTVEPQLVDPDNGNFRPVTAGNVFGVTTYTIPDFAGDDRPQPPLAPTGNLVNEVPRDSNYGPRADPGIPGAFDSGGSIIRPSMPLGPVLGYAGVSYSYRTYATYPVEVRVKYTFDWGDGTTTDTSYVDSGISTSASHIWTRAGTYQVKARATNNAGIPSVWSDSLAVKVAANNPPKTPSKPSGPASGYAYVSYSYSAASTDPDRNQVRYTFDWGDATNSTTGLVKSGTKASVSHLWNRAGTFQVRVKASDSRNAFSGWSNSQAVKIAANNPPEAPSIPSGPSLGYVQNSYSFSVSSTDPDGDRMKYTFDWGDGTSSVTGLVNSGTMAKTAHIWHKAGKFYVKSKATDSRGASSDWSNSIEINIIQSRKKSSLLVNVLRYGDVISCS